MVDFVNEHTEYRALWRYGGNLGLIKSLVAGGFVVIEKNIAHDTTQSGWDTTVSSPGTTIIWKHPRSDAYGCSQLP
jgi:hypothetical protein